MPAAAIASAAVAVLAPDSLQVPAFVPAGVTHAVFVSMGVQLLDVPASESKKHSK